MSSKPITNKDGAKPSVRMSPRLGTNENKSINKEAIAKLKSPVRMLSPQKKIEEQ